MKILTDDILKEILAESASAYFFQKIKEKETRDGFQSFYEDDGSVIVTFTTGMAQVEPEEIDLSGRSWNPRLKDKDGNPILDTFGANKGNPRKAWDKFEAKAIINETETVYGFGGKNGILIKGFVAEMTKNKIMNSQLPGTKWKIKCNLPAGNNKFNTWSIEFLGKGEIPKEKPKKNENNDSKPDNGYNKLTNALIEVRDDNSGRALAGFIKVDLIEALVFKTELNAKIIEKYFVQLEEDEIIRVDGEKVFIQ